MKVTSTLAAALLLVLTSGCAGRNYETVRLPPRIDLRQHEMIGVIEFETQSDGELGRLATRRFTELARRDQGMVRIVTFGSDSAAARDVAAFRALGREHGLQTIVVGELTVSDIRPDISIAATLRSGSLSARVDATLSVRMIETATGASIWSSSARATKDVGHVSVIAGGKFVFDAEDPERAYGGLVDTLVAQVTRDFQVSWERR